MSFDSSTATDSFTHYRDLFFSLPVAEKYRICLIIVRHPNNFNSLEKLKFGEYSIFIWSDLFEQSPRLEFPSNLIIKTQIPNSLKNENNSHLSQNSAMT